MGTRQSAGEEASGTKSVKNVKVKFIAASQSDNSQHILKDDKPTGTQKLDKPCWIPCLIENSDISYICHFTAHIQHDQNDYICKLN